LSRLGSPQVGSRRVAIAKAKNDIFVVLLSIAVGAMVVACILLALEMNSYEWSVKAKVRLDSPQPVRVMGADVRLASVAEPSERLMV
jgi:hypothetical protein